MTRLPFHERGLWVILVGAMIAGHVHGHWWRLYHLIRAVFG